MYIRGLIKNIRDRIYCRKMKASTSYLKLSPSKYGPPDCMQRFQRSFHFSMHVWLACLGMACNYHVVFSCISASLEIVSPSGCSSAWGRGRSCRGPNLVSKVGGEPWGSCAWPRIPWHSGLRGIVHCHSAEARYRKTICEAFSDELHLEGVAERLCRQSDSWSGIGEETRDAPDPPHQRKRSAFSWHLTGLASLSSAEVTMASSTVTQRCFSECLLQHFVHFCGCLTKFLAELDANMLLLQHTNGTNTTAL
jgi:hypothetical protein